MTLLIAVILSLGELKIHVHTSERNLAFKVGHVWFPCACDVYCIMNVECDGERFYQPSNGYHL